MHIGMTGRFPNCRNNNRTTTEENEKFIFLNLIVSRDFCCRRFK